MRVLLSICVVCLMDSWAFADDTLTLPQVIAAAVRASPDFERASLDVQSAEGAALAAQGIEDTHVGASVSYGGERDLSGKQASLDDGQSIVGTLSIQRMFSTGTRVQVSAGSNWAFAR